MSEASSSLAEIIYYWYYNLLNSLFGYSFKLHHVTMMILNIPFYKLLVKTLGMECILNVLDRS